MTVRAGLTVYIIIEHLLKTHFTSFVIFITIINRIIQIHCIPPLLNTAYAHLVLQLIQPRNNLHMSSLTCHCDD
jgi:hypothetical protein